MKSFQNFIDEGKKCPEGKYYCFTDKKCKKKGYNSFCNNGDPTGSLFLCVDMQTINIVTGGKDNVTFQMGNTRSPRIRSRNP